MSREHGEEKHFGDFQRDSILQLSPRLSSLSTGSQGFSDENVSPSRRASVASNGSAAGARVMLGRTSSMRLVSNRRKSALNSMLQQKQARNQSIVPLFQRFIPNCVEAVLKLHPKLSADGNKDTPPVPARFEAAVVFADASGFTALTERFAAQENGAEQLCQALNAFFTKVLDLVSSHGGDVMKFSGDAITIIFPVRFMDSRSAAYHDINNMPPPPDPIENINIASAKAAYCCVCIHDEIRGYRAGKDVQLGLHIGVGCGDLAMIHVGGVFGRWEYLLAGPALDEIAIAEPLAKTGETVVSPRVWGYVEPVATGTPCAPPQHTFMRLETVDPEKDLDLCRPPTCMRDVLMEAHHIPLLRRYVPGAVHARLDIGVEDFFSELRRVSVVFVHIVGLDVIAALDRPGEGGADPHQLMRSLQEVVYQQEGSVNKFLVDDKGLLLLCVFGLPPFAHVDDPRRAVMAANNIVSLLSDMGLHSSVGVTSGEVFCGVVGSPSRHEFTVMGDTVNLAARLMCSAQQDSVLVCVNTYKLCRKDLDFVQLEPITVKGKVKAVEIYRPMSEQLMVGRRHTSLYGCITGLLHSRSGEEQLMLERLESIGNHGGGVLLITGLQGSGKGELFNHAVDTAKANGLLVVSSAKHQDLNQRMSAWRGVLADILSMAGGGDAKLDPSVEPANEEERRVRADHLLALMPEGSRDSAGVLDDLLDWPLFGGNAKVDALPEEGRKNLRNVLIKEMLRKLAVSRHVVVALHLTTSTNKSSTDNSDSWDLAKLVGLLCASRYRHSRRNSLLMGRTSVGLRRLSSRRASNGARSGRRTTPPPPHNAAATSPSHNRMPSPNTLQAMIRSADAAIASGVDEVAAVKAVESKLVWAQDEVGLASVDEAPATSEAPHAVAPYAGTPGLILIVVARRPLPKRKGEMKKFGDIMQLAVANDACLVLRPLESTPRDIHLAVALGADNYMQIPSDVSKVTSEFGTGNPKHIEYIADSLLGEGVVEVEEGVVKVKEGAKYSELETHALPYRLSCELIGMFDQLSAMQQIILKVASLFFEGKWFTPELILARLPPEHRNGMQMKWFHHEFCELVDLDILQYSTSSLLDPAAEIEAHCKELGAHPLKTEDLSPHTGVFRVYSRGIEKIAGSLMLASQRNELLRSVARRQQLMRRAQNALRRASMLAVLRSGSDSDNSPLTPSPTAAKAARRSTIGPGAPGLVYLAPDPRVAIASGRSLKGGSGPRKHSSTLLEVSQAQSLKLSAVANSSGIRLFDNVHTSSAHGSDTLSEGEEEDSAEGSVRSQDSVASPGGRPPERKRSSAQKLFGRIGNTSSASGRKRSHRRHASSGARSHFRKVLSDDDPSVNSIDDGDTSTVAGVARRAGRASVRVLVAAVEGGAAVSTQGGVSEVEGRNSSQQVHNDGTVLSGGGLGGHHRRTSTNVMKLAQQFDERFSMHAEKQMSIRLSSRISAGIGGGGGGGGKLSSELPATGTDVDDQKSEEK